MKKSILVLVTALFFSTMLYACSNDPDESNTSQEEVLEVIEETAETTETTEEAQIVKYVKVDEKKMISENTDVRSSDIIALDDGGYVWLGKYSVGKTQSDTYCKYFDKDFNEVWSTSIPDCDLASLAETNDGFLLTGSTKSTGDIFESNHGDSDAAVVMLDKNGGIKWSALVGGTAYDTFGSHSYTKTNKPVVLDSGNILIAGTSESSDGDLVDLSKGDADGFIAEFDASGNLVQIKTYGGSEHDAFTTLLKDSSGNIIAIGTSESNDGFFEGVTDRSEGHVFVAKLDSKLDLVWVKTIDTEGQSWGTGAAIGQDDSIALYYGQYAGESNPNTEEQSYTTITKFEKDGEELWTKHYSGGNANYVVSFANTVDDSYLLTCEAYDEDWSMFGWISEISADGDIVWEKSYNSNQSIMIQTLKLANGNYFATGYETNEEGYYTASLFLLSETDTPEAEETVETESVSENIVYSDGTYEGIARGLYAGVHVKVTITDGKIASIELGDNLEDEPYITDAAAVINKIINEQSTDVDAVSGATYSSNGIMHAVEYALRLASGN